MNKPLPFNSTTSEEAAMIADLVRAQRRWEWIRAHWLQLVLGVAAVLLIGGSVAGWFVYKHYQTIASNARYLELARTADEEAMVSAMGQVSRDDPTPSIRLLAGFRLADIHLKKGRHQEALDVLTQIESASKTMGSFYHNLQQLWTSQALLAFKDNAKILEAVAILEKLSAQESTVKPVARTLLADARWQAGQKDQTIALLQELHQDNAIGEELQLRSRQALESLGVTPNPLPVDLSLGGLSLGDESGDGVNTDQTDQTDQTTQNAEPTPPPLDASAASTLNGN